MITFSFLSLNLKKKFIKTLKYKRRKTEVLTLQINLYTGRYFHFITTFQTYSNYVKKSKCDRLLCYYSIRLSAIFGGLLNGCISTRTGN
jgi:hypothetical protein